MVRGTRAERAVGVPLAQGPSGEAPGDGCLVGQLGEEHVDRSPGLDLAGGRGRILVCLHQRQHHLLERAARSLQERRPLTLAVVADQDDVVRARRSTRRRELLQAFQHRVEPSQGVHRLGSDDARVVRDLVVVDEVDVDRLGPRHHRLDDQCDVEVAQEDVGDPAQGDVGAVAADAGLHIEPFLPAGLEHLLAHLADRQQHCPEESSRVSEEGGVRARRP